MVLPTLPFNKIVLTKWNRITAAKLYKALTKLQLIFDWGGMAPLDTPMCRCVHARMCARKRACALGYKSSDFFPNKIVIEADRRIFHDYRITSPDDRAQL